MPDVISVKEMVLNLVWKNAFGQPDNGQKWIYPLDSKSEVVSGRSDRDLITFNIVEEKTVPNSDIYTCYFKKANFPKPRVTLNKSDWEENCMNENCN